MSLLEPEVTRAYDAWLVRDAARKKQERRDEQRKINANVTRFCNLLNESFGLSLVKELRKIGMTLEGTNVADNRPYAVFPWYGTTVKIVSCNKELRLCQLHGDHEFNYSGWYSDLPKFREGVLSRLGGLREEWRTKQAHLATADDDTRPDQ